MSDLSFQRDQLLAKVDDFDEWDIIIIGGGATGAGIALDSATRGYRTLLLEQSDFGKGTSSRSTKLIHGGVRYLEQGNLKLVREALRERERLLHNAPHLVHDLSFVIPTQTWWSRFYYGLGLKAYDWLAGRQDFGRSQKISSQKTYHWIPGLKRGEFRGGVLYHDGQFDDARLVINLMQTAVTHGAVTLNYCEVVGLQKNSNGHVAGVQFLDHETQRVHDVAAKCVINATGPFSDRVRILDDSEVCPLIMPSRGIHLVLDGKFLGGFTAMLVPKTRDGRVVFAIPWHGHCVLGTTDTPVDVPTLEPGYSPEEIDFLLETAADYFDPAPTRDDILSTFSGLRPLVNPKGTVSSSNISREHTIEVSESGLISIAGGKWTTYREMAEECVERAAELADLPRKQCVTANLELRGAMKPSLVYCGGRFWDIFGSDRGGITQLENAHPEWQKPLINEHFLTKSEVVWMIREEMARTLEDVLSRRDRILLLNVKVAKLLAEPVADILAAELDRDTQWRNQQVTEFNSLADSYLPSND